MVDMDYWLGRKYAILQQQADATTKNAGTAALTGASSANLDDVRARLAPAQSVADIAKLNAEANLIGQQASVVVPESRARIRNLDAESSLTGTQNKVLTRSSLTPFRSLFGDPGGSLESVLGSGGYQGYRLGSILGN